MYGNVIIVDVERQRGVGDALDGAVEMKAL
jgi:hypothetical protein